MQIDLTEFHDSCFIRYEIKKKYSSFLFKYPNKFEPEIKKHKPLALILKESNELVIKYIVYSSLNLLKPSFYQSLIKEKKV